MVNRPPPFRSPFASKRVGAPMIDGVMEVRTFFVTSARVTFPSAQAFLIELIATQPAWCVAGPNAPDVSVFTNFPYSATIALAFGSKWRSGAKIDTYPLLGLNWDGE